MDKLLADRSLTPNQSLKSASGRLELDFQPDGNVVLYRTDNHTPLWATGTNGHQSDRLTMQQDGNLVLYQQGGMAVWASHTNGAGADCYAILQDDGNFVIYKPGGTPIWASNTVLDWEAVTIPPKTLDLGNGFYIAADAEYNARTRQATFHVAETCTNKILGFTAGVQLFYYNSAGQLIGTTGTIDYGIDRAPLIGANHRYETWSGTAPEGTAAIGLAYFADPHFRIDALGDLGRQLATTFDDIGKIVINAGKATVDFCNQNPQLCAATIFAVATVVVIASGGTLVLEAGGLAWVLVGGATVGL